MKLEELKALGEKQSKKVNQHTLTPSYDVMLTLASRGTQYKDKSITAAIYNDNGSRLRNADYILPIWDEDTMRIYLMPSDKINGYKGTKEIKASRVKYTRPELAKLIGESKLEGSYNLEKDIDCGVWYISLYDRYRKYLLKHKK